MSNKKSFFQDSMERRTFLKWSALAGSVVAAGGSSLLVGCSGTNASQATEEPSSTIGNTNAAISDGLPYGADKIVATACGCGDVCGMLHMADCYVKDDKIVYYEGSTEGWNKGALCARGMAGMTLINNPDRIKYPMRRTNEKGVKGEFKQITWEEALEEISDAMITAIQEDGPQSVFCGGGHASSSLMIPMWSRFSKLFGFGVGEVLGGCYNDQKVGSTATLGDYYHCMEEDPCESKLLILWGENDAVAKPQEWADSFWKAKKEHGTKIISIEPRFTPTAAKSDMYAPLRPGTDSYVALAMANVIITEGLEDKDFIEKHTYGYEEYKDLALKYTPELVEKISWMPADQIRQIAREYATTKPAMLCVGRGGNQTGGADSNAGWMMSRSISCLIGLCGQAGMKGAAMSMEASVGTTNGTTFHWASAATTGIPTANAPEVVKRTVPNTLWENSSSIYSGTPYKIRVFMTYGNHAASAGGQDGMEEALKRIPLVATYGRHFNWTASQFSDIVLPIAMWTETARWRRDWEAMCFNMPAIPPMFESKTDNDFYKELSRLIAKKLDSPFKPEEVWPWESDVEICDAIASSEITQTEFQKRLDEGRTELAKYMGATTTEKASEFVGSIHGPFYANLPDFIPYKAKTYGDLVPEGTDPEAVFFPTYNPTEGSGKLLFKCDWIGAIDPSIPALPLPCEPCDSWYAQGNPIESGNWELSDAVKQGYAYSAVGKGHQFWQFLSFNQGADGGPASPWHREAFVNANEPCVEMNARDAHKQDLIDGDSVTVESQYGKMENIRLVATENIQPGTIVPPYHWGNVQNRIYPQSLSFANTPAAWVPGALNPQLVGPWKAKASLGGGCQCVQSAVLCKVYKA